MFESARRDLAWVPRWGIIRVNRRQSVAEHSYFVACYGVKIARIIGWNKTNPENIVRLIVYLLRHDEDEAFTSDVPSPIKDMVEWDESKFTEASFLRFGPGPVIPDGAPEIRRVADLLDECMYLAGELNSGNRFVQNVLLRARVKLRTAVMDLPAGNEEKEALWVLVSRAVDEEMGVVKELRGLVKDCEKKNAPENQGG